jgi:uncharacterized protein (TIGR03118 family)
MSKLLALSSVAAACVAATSLAACGSATEKSPSSSTGADTVRGGYGGSGYGGNGGGGNSGTGYGNSPSAALVVAQTNLTGDVAGTAAKTDPQLVDAWGIAFNATGGAWVSDNGTGLTTVYDGTGALKLTVRIPAPAAAVDAGADSDAGPALSTPTGQVFNGVATDFGGDHFIFVTEDGTLSGWNGGATAVLHADNSGQGAVYKGIGLGQSPTAGALLYLANFNSGNVDVYDNAYNATTVAGGFSDYSLPSGYAPFNIVVFGTQVFVTYAVQNSAKHDEVDGAGNGIVDLFDTDGNFIQRIATGGALNAPWGVAMAPASWGSLGGSLLVGNFGDGTINAFGLSQDPYGNLVVTPQGFLGNADGSALSIDGLWGLQFAPDAGLVNSNQLYFTAGPSQETHGLFGRIELPGLGAPSGDASAE